MLNPSTADAEKNDPTIRRCIGYATEWGYKTLYVGNIFAYRSTDPKKLKQVKDPIGIENDFQLLEVAQMSAMVVVAWGNHGGFMNRGKEVYKYMERANIKLYALRTLKTGQPSHPLYLPKKLKPKRWKI